MMQIIVSHNIIITGKNVWNHIPNFSFCVSKLVHTTCLVVVGLSASCYLWLHPLSQALGRGLHLGYCHRLSLLCKEKFIWALSKVCCIVKLSMSGTSSYATVHSNNMWSVNEDGPKERSSGKEGRAWAVTFQTPSIMCQLHLLGN